ncbi:preprotein translocase, subunit A [Deferribacter desulfuricans SSM1]|uniref:Protein translocase subunit SecA n=1 Tax=Deferribacter desulfuricans (strain DSM 14783 / JCM 11476 / NBRC 101012 / SSM1) TaxID=639282 RepID=D3PAD5_DEFDS|nr:preprotein translocase subunit SecA [Deferribacter desulfuricans]BAI79558.1 preprotein translocase, subunit A [Deferribacter desulfuricans SSM1]
MIEFITKKLFGSYNDRYLKKIRPILEKVNAKEPEIQALSNEELSKKTDEFKSRLQNGETLDDILVDAFAVTREVSKRTLNMRHFDVQILGGYVLHKGKIAEMKTGEGKTLVATLALYLNALTEKGAHLVTVNDYLARRDAMWMAPIYLFLGLTVGVIQHEISYLVEWDNKEKFTTKLVECDRKTAYQADITYGTNNEFGFDYLRDNMKYDINDYVQRDLHYAIVDEVDSILIDEARTPLIISGPTDERTDKYYEIDRVVRVLKKDEDYTVDEKSRTVKLTDSGINKIEKALNIDNLFDVRHVDTLHFVNNALKAHALFKRDVDYVVQDGKVIIVDEFTGRLMPGRRFSEGLHQALEAKEGVEIESENQTLASITFQNYFRMYEKLAGMTGTAATEAQEFREIYGLDVIVIPTHKPMIRKDFPDVIYRTAKEKYDAIVDEIVEMHSIGRPVLVGTTSIEKSEYLSKLLRKKGIPHEVLNAKYHEREAQIVAKAGEKKAVTIATNMAGRGTDIKLGPGVAELGGLHILGTERHESRRIDNQLRGRAGRQGDPGSSRFFLSLEDDLLRIFGSDKISAIMNKLGMKEGEPIEHPLISRAIENAQKKVEAMHFEIRKHLLEYDNVMNQQRQVVYTLRRTILEGKDLDDIVNEHIENVLDGLIKEFIDAPDDPDFESFAKSIEKIFDIKIDLTDRQSKKDIDEDKKVILQKINEKIEMKKNEIGEHYYGFVRFLLINILDNRWKEHLLNMDYLRDSVGLRGYGQKDPLIEYKRESYNLFMDMMNRISFEFVEFLSHVQVERDEELELKQEEKNIKEERRDIFSDEQPKEEKKKPIKRATPKVGRNDPCPCGSGKKYKKCCGANQ